ncbi:Light-harvesting complex-like protein [Drosera capensis]
MAIPSPPTTLSSSTAASVSPLLFTRFSSPLSSTTLRPSHRRSLAVVKAAATKLPSGVEAPRVEPRLKPAFLGFTRTAETWNSRACMIGLIGTFIVELIINKGILEVIGVEVGKGLDIPL